MKYRPDIDGLRAIAIAPVLLFHSGVPGFSGGYVGVDVFFVISGYVIALSLKEDLETGKFSILRFYTKRIRRIFPALFVMVLVAFVMGYLLLLPSAFLDLSLSTLASAGFVSNVYFWKNSSYFAADASTRPLLHTWSLSVEEQYYVFTPILMFVIFRWFRERWLLLLGPIVAASFVISLLAAKYAANANFYLLPSRVWELLIGTLLALAPPRPLSRRLLNEAHGACMYRWSWRFARKLSPPTQRL
jgi:peptidoglycan/LPS O-acetylase OafA/YrhL